MTRHGLSFRELPDENQQNKMVDAPLAARPSPENPALKSAPYNAYLERYKELQQVFLQNDDDASQDEPACTLLPDFDVYRFRSGFKKTDPGEPDFHVLVSSQQQKMPSIYQLDILRRRFKVIYVGLVDVGSISFYKLY